MTNIYKGFLEIYFLKKTITMLNIEAKESSQKRKYKWLNIRKETQLHLQERAPN